MRTKAFEDYLKIIYKLSQEGMSEKGVSTSSIAERLKISQASVSNMLKKLADQGLIQYEPYYGVTLTEQGHDIAVNMIRRHRILELYLVERLSYSWDEVDAEAEVLEHAVSDKMINRMWEELGQPLRDPHGAPIPTESGEILTTETFSLANVQEGELVKVARFQNRSPDELRYLHSIGLIRKADVKIIHKAPFEGPVTIEINGAEYAIDLRLAKSIFVA